LAEGGPAALVGEGNNRVGLVFHLCGLGVLLSTGLAITNPDIKNRTTKLVPTFFSFIPVFVTTCDQLVMALHDSKKILNEKFLNLLLDSPTGLLDSIDELITSNAQMDLLLTSNFPP